jgi:N-acetylmuramoyl-L-alanine amidase
MTMKVVISAGHGKYIRGMSSEWLDEVDEARRVTAQVGDNLRQAGVDVVTYWDDVSDDQQENLKRICDFHNAQGKHDLDVSIHFNASNGQGHGCEVFYTSSAGREYADAIVDAICEASGLTNRGPKDDDSIGGLYFLSHTAAVSVLIEVCFGDNESDCTTYYDEFDNICEAIDRAICAVGDHDSAPGPEPEPPTDDALLQVNGSCSWFGGPNDDGVAPDEGLAFLYKVSDAPELFLPTQPPGTTGLARRLDPETFYVACRWDYSVTSKDYLRDQTRKALVRANDKEFLAQPADWGPHEDTGRVADISPGLMEALGIETDDQVEVIYPAPDDIRPPGPEPEATVSITIEASGPVKVIVNGTPIS